ncbi:LysE family transporter [Paenibacillus sp. BR2-3]|uniref:LysE/ArgO family amino acid transporter n=1 Tax=Paenibacillus sp. BR2-3 TaxID=3048494 RepID=UPI0039772CAE
MFMLWIQGFLLGLAYVAPIGMQNMYVINSALSMNRAGAYRTAFVTAFFDISLALACFYGIGSLLEKFTILQNVFMIFGTVAIVLISISLIRSKPSNSEEVQVSKSFMKVVSHCFAVTWLNPQAIIDGTVILGGMRSSLVNYSGVFIAGVSTSSLFWFFSLTMLMIINKNKIGTKMLKVINVLCGLVILFFGVKMGYSFIFG